MISVDKDFIPVKQGFSKKYYLKEVLSLLNHPEAKLPTINVVGTNGKGSTSFYLSKALLNKYKKVGLFISPAFLYQNERIQINNQYISDEDLKTYLSKVEPYIDQFKLTFFEIWTLIAILYFVDQEVEIVVMEAGIGGIKDSTNLMTNQIAVLLTAVGFDHQEILGNSLESILENKLKIIKPNRDLFISHDNLHLKPLIDKIIKQLPYELTVHWTGLVTDQIYYQQANKGLVRDFAKTLKINDESYLQLTPPLGRFTVLNKKPLILIDGAHNENGIESFIQSFKQAYPNKTPLVLAGFSYNKDFESHLKQLNAAFPNQVYLTSFDHFKSWTVPEQLSSIKVNDWKAFLNKKIQNQDDIIICGSLYFIPQVYDWLKKH